MMDIGRDSQPRALEGTYSVQLPRPFCYGKAFRLPFAVSRDVELTLTSDTVLIGPESEPVHLPPSGFSIGDNFIATDTRYTGCVVFAKTSANPDVMLKRRMSKKKSVAIFKSSLQCVAFSAMN